MIIKPKILAADCPLEQLDSQKLGISLDLLKGAIGPINGSVITDNRLDEWNYAIKTIPIADLSPDPSRHPPVPPLDSSQIDRLDPSQPQGSNCKTSPPATARPRMFSAVFQ